MWVNCAHKLANQMSWIITLQLYYSNTPSRAMEIVGLS